MAGTPAATAWTRFETGDRERAFDHLVDAYGPCFRMSSSRDDYSLRHAQFRAPAFSLVDSFFTELAFTVEGMDALMICELDEGRAERELRRSTERFEAGDVVLMVEPDVPYRARYSGAGVRCVILPPSLLVQLDGTTSRRSTAPLRFTGHRPMNAAAARRWALTRAFVSELVTDPGAAAQPLVLGSAARMLAASALSTFPNTALAGVESQDRQDRRDGGHATLRRAIAYIDSQVAKDIGIADIAEACHVSTRAVQLAFRRHLDTTPTAYLRRVRLDQAHRDLVRADPRRETVSEIAGRWGFADHSRFSAQYRRAYGVSPSHTLHRGEL